jgi:magnesium-dependent phosphatase-1
MSTTKPWLLATDIDGTLWDNLDISLVAPPYLPDGKGRLRSADGTIVRLIPEAIDFVKWCRRNGAKVTSLSWNIPERVFPAIDVLGISDLFDFHATEYTEAKHERLFDLLGKLRRRGIIVPPPRVVYVDDRDIHIKSIRKKVGDVVWIHIWKEVPDYSAAKRIVRKKVLKSS